MKSLSITGHILITPSSPQEIILFKFVDEEINEIVNDKIKDSQKLQSNFHSSNIKLSEDNLIIYLYELYAIDINKLCKEISSQLISFFNSFCLKNISRVILDYFLSFYSISLCNFL